MTAATAPLTSANRRLAAKLGAVVIGMFAFGYALVPIYNAVCQSLGINGKTRSQPALVSNQQSIDVTREVIVEFVTAVNGSVPWEFHAPDAPVVVHPGAVTQVMFRVRNLANAPITARAIPSIAPVEAARHFVKTECFCFRLQRLAAGETRDMPVRFIVDSRLPSKVGEITLSYTFFAVDEPLAVAQASR